MTSGSTRSGVGRAARMLFVAAALGEIAVGLVVLAFPQVLALLVAGAFDGAGLLAERMVGAAICALGVTWWIARNDPPPQVWARHGAGFLIYNFGVGALFVVRALTVTDAALPWIVGVVHLLAGLAIGAAVLAAQGTESSRVK